MRKITMLGLCLTALCFTNSAHARPTVVELFTSQGCSSCPAGEEVVAKLNERDDIFALSFHVTYWDKLGWKDTFAKPEFTKRQKNYAKVFNGSLYTPQAVVDGMDDTIASWGWRVKMLSANSRDEQVNVPVTIEEIHSHAFIKLPTYTLSKPVDVWYITYNGQTQTHVKAGENRGEDLRSVNVVRSLEKLLVWNGEERKIPKPYVLNAGEKVAILIQEQNAGKILGLYYN